MLEMGAFKQEPMEEDPLRLDPVEEPVDPNRRRLPPRRRGAR